MKKVKKRIYVQEYLIMTAKQVMGEITGQYSKDGALIFNLIDFERHIRNYNGFSKYLEKGIVAIDVIYDDETLESDILKEYTQEEIDHEHDEQFNEMMENIKSTNK